MLRRPAALAAVGAALLALGAAEVSRAAAVEVIPAWNARFQPARPTEIRVRLVPESGGILTVEVRQQGTASVRRTVPVTSLGVLELRLPVRPVAPELRLVVGLDERPLADLPVPLAALPSGRPVAAVAAAPEVRLPLSELSNVHVAAADLPHHADAYRTVDLLVVDGPTLAVLEPPQLDALEQHVRLCGRLLLIGMSEAERAPVDGVAGCGGRFVSAVAAPENAAHAAARLLADGPRALPAPARLIPLLDDDPSGASIRALTPVVLYLLILVALLARRAAPLPLLLLPVGAAATLFASSGPGWGGAEPSRRWASWAEGAAGEPVTRQASLLRVRGNGIGQIQVPLPEHLPMPESLERGAAPPRIRYDGDARSLELDGRLLRTHDVGFTGSAALAAALRLALADGVPRVENVAAARSQPALLAWQDRKYPVPSLESGQTWLPSDRAAVPWGATAAERLFRERALTSAAALLIGAPNAAVGGGTDYLMVRP